ncbi:MAG: hypothetical protein V4608_03150 [Bacteroidota bacterium]
MRILKISIFTLLLTSLFLKKASSQSVNYKILEDNPYQNNLSVSLMPFYTDFAPNNNLSLGYGIDASLIYKKLATAHFYMERPYTDGTDWGYHFGTVGIFPSPTVNKLRNFLHLELGAAYHLSDRTVTRSRKVVLSSSTGSKYTTTTYISVPATVRKIVAVRGGIYNYHTAITARQYGDVPGDLGIDANGVIATDGTRFGGAARLYSTPEDPFFNTESSTMMKVLGVYGGISSSGYHRVMVDTDAYGVKGGSRYINFYADAMFAPVRIDDFVGIDGKKYDVSGKNAQGFKTRPFGARIGYEYILAKKRIGYYAKTELGFKPGLANSKFYVSLGFGLSINGKIKKLAAES